VLVCACALNLMTANCRTCGAVVLVTEEMEWLHSSAACICCSVRVLRVDCIVFAQPGDHIIVA
jgi:hypothetical protein